MFIMEYKVRYLYHFKSGVLVARLLKPTVTDRW